MSFPPKFSIIVNEIKENQVLLFLFIFSTRLSHQKHKEQKEQKGQKAFYPLKEALLSIHQLFEY